MKLHDYPNLDGKQVWLSQDEFDQLLEVAKDSRHRLAFHLGGRSGMRESEITSVRYRDFRDAGDGFVRVWGDFAKRDRYREPPINNTVQTIVQTRADHADPDDRVIPVSTRTIERWVQRAREILHDRTDDEGWLHLTPHDLRRTWAAWCLFDRGRGPATVFVWGGWTDWATFYDHYLGEMSPEAARRARDALYSDQTPEREAENRVFQLKQ